ncbi:MAG: bifunctional glutamate N-acetyltransferase/amino-acid acetyltransferase ArgJ [bacterium]|nr:bifunctional glutamate N-acetyltransferase/amino-acid acetyltransferase ArgJ [bacterium]
MNFRSEELHIPRDFLATGWHIGIKTADLDFGVLHSRRACSAAAVFTQNNFPGHPVVIGREHIRDGRLQTIIVNSGNSNVATGPAGLALARKTCATTAEHLGLPDPSLVLPSSTGVIGRQMPGDVLLGACNSISEHLKDQADFPAFARAICTTDAYPKLASRELSSGVRITGVAKGAGMIEPDMATMLAYFASDAAIDPANLDRLFRAVMDRSINRISVDGDTSTSDTAVILANGASDVKVSFSPAADAEFRALAVPIDPAEIAKIAALDAGSAEFVGVLYEIALELAKLIVADGEGARRYFEVRVSEARDAGQALRIARSIANSPLVKTAIHGADPNWGRLVMAIGKVPDGPGDISRLKIFFGEQALHSENGSDPEVLKTLSAYIQDHREVKMHVALGAGDAQECVWASDLSREYVHLNSEYTT